MSKKKKIIIISVICAALIIGAVAAFLMLGNDDDDMYKNFNEDEQYLLEKNGAKEYSSPVLVLWGEDEQLVGVTQLGNKVYLNNPDNIPVEQGSIASRIQITVDDDGVRRGNLCYPYSTNVYLPVYASQNSAPEAMADMRLKCLMNSPGLASITDYKINSVTLNNVTSGETGTAIINYTVNCDVKPAKHAEVYGEADGDGWCRGLEYDYAIWGTYETWHLLGGDPIVELTGNYSKSSVRVIEETTLYAGDTHVLNYASFTSPEQSILTDKPVTIEEDDGTEVDPGEEEIQGEGENSIYYTELFTVDLDDASVEIIEHGMRNLQYNHVIDYNDKVYMTTSIWDNASEPIASHLICYDTNTRKITRLMDRAVILGLTEDTLYAYGSNTVGGVYRPQDIYAVDLATGTVKWATEPVMIANEENRFIDQGVYDGYLHVMYAKDKIAFKLDEETGEWSFHYAG